MTEKARQLKLGDTLVVTVEEFGPPLVDESSVAVTFWPINSRDAMPGFNVTMPSGKWKEFREFIFGIEFPI